ncbi:MAG: hypothetical protein ACI4IS_01145 [Acutalibacteraceae bacterium]
MLTLETLKQNTALQGLTDEQFNAIAEMSKNDENVVIGNRIGALHGQYDADILSVTGISKKDGEKSYDYAKRILSDYKKQVTDLQSQIAKGNGDDALKQQLKDTKAQVTQLQAKLTEKETEIANNQANFDKQLKDTHVDYAFRAATAGLKFKQGITEPIQQTLLSAAKAEILSKGTPDFIDNGKGGKSLIFRNADGNILNNPKNNLNPFTIQELIMETALKDVIDTNRVVTGGGTGNGGSGKGGNSVSIDFSGIRSQVEADRAIESYLLSQGLTRDSQEFADKSLQIRTENNVAELPIK